MIEVKHVTKTFDGFRALDGLTMSVPDGSIYGLVGPNGAGKSTILRHITGIYRQDEGEVLVAGEPVYENPAVKARIASIPDELYIPLRLHPGHDAALPGLLPPLRSETVRGHEGHLYHRK